MTGVQTCALPIWGRIINISGTNARNAGNLSGGARNTSLVHLTKTLAVQVGRHGITVNCIAPGVVATEATLQTIPREMVEQIAAMQSVPGVLEAEDLTAAAVFFASEEARFVSGQVLVIDGGRNMPA